VHYEERDEADPDEEGDGQQKPAPDVPEHRVPAGLSVALHKYGVAPRGSMRRIRQGVATEAYWASTVRERNEAGADAAALECNHIYETQH
jgi:hypothetical protein